jgi:prepilin-type processing-associated H-X9-DG protein
MLEALIEYGLNAGKFAMQQDENAPKIPSLFFELIKGELRTILPEVDGDKLIFKTGQGFALANQQSVIAASGIAVALLLPAVQATREAARRAQCSNNLKQIVLSLHNYHDAYSSFPPLYTVDKNGKPLHSWRVLVLPFMEQSNLYEQIRLDEPWDSEFNKQFHNVVIPQYVCPSCKSVQFKNGKNCCYTVITGEGIIPAKTSRDKTGGGIERITDGTSNTVGVLEVKEPFCWMDPNADITMADLAKGINQKDSRLGSYHARGINIAMFDGSVRFISETIDLKMLKALGTRAGGEAVGF